MYKSSKLYAVSTAALGLSLLMSGNANALSTSEDHYALKLLGKFVFFDEISVPERQACVSCHEPSAGGTNNNSRVNQTVVAVPGANFHVSGGLKPPANGYASLIETFKTGCGRGAPPTGQACGGNFWNGRAEGRPDAVFPDGATKHIGEEVFQGITDPVTLVQVTAYSAYFGPTSDQALNPMPNTVEQNIERQAVCEHVASAEYAELYEVAWGVPINCSDDPVAVSAPDVVAPETEFDISFKRLMLAVGAWQASGEVNSFSSKRDIALRSEMACREDLAPDVAAEVEAYYDAYFCQQLALVKSEDSWGKFPLLQLTDQENLGHDLFYNVFVPFGPNPAPPLFPELPATQCAFCHHSPDQPSDGTGLFETYADDSYHNIGTPANPQVPAAPDTGLTGHNPDVPPGFFRAVTLRNVDKRPNSRFIKAYTHNGFFKSLESLVHFYNTSNVDGATAASFGITRCPPEITTERRALRANCWPEPEWPGAAGFLVGNLGMNAEHEAALVAYLKTLTDTVTAVPPQLSELYALTGSAPEAAAEEETTTIRRRR